MTDYEVYARRTGKLHPRCRYLLEPFFAPALLESVTIEVVGPTLRTLGGAFGWRGVIVLGQTVYLSPGLLDADATIHGVTWSWTRPIGIANWAHEVRHCQQWQDAPGRMLRQFVTGAVRSWVRGKWYVHDYFPYEQDALAFERKVWQYYTQHPLPPVTRSSMDGA